MNIYRIQWNILAVSKIKYQEEGLKKLNFTKF